MSIPPEVLDNPRLPKVAALLIALMFCALLFVVFTSDAFLVVNVSASGNKYLPSKEIETASGVLNSNLFSIEPEMVAKAVQALPEVKSVRVSTSVPNQIVIDVEERQPQILWQTGSEAFWIDQEGIAFALRANLGNLVVVTDLDQLPVRLGEPVASAAFAAVNAMRKTFPDGPRVFGWSSGRGLAFTNDRGWKIYLGDSSEMAGKAAKYRALVAQLSAQNAKIKFIDLGKGDPYYQ